VGATNIGFERVHGGFGYVSRNQEGEDVLNFALAYELLIAKTFRKRESHIVTFCSGQHSRVCCHSTQACGGGLSLLGTCPPG
jgi:hypothetical protein